MSKHWKTRLDQNHVVLDKFEPLTMSDGLAGVPELVGLIPTAGLCEVDACTVGVAAAALELIKVTRSNPQVIRENKVTTSCRGGNAV